MPQLSITDQPDHAMSITIEDLTWKGDPGFKVTVRRAREEGDFTTVSVARYTGVGVDMLQTAYREIVGAWLYGDPRDLKRAADSCARAARRWAVEHESVTMH